MRMRRFLLLPIALAIPPVASAQAVTQRTEVTVPTLTTPTGTSAGVWAGNTFYLSGTLDPDLDKHHDTTSQTVGLLNYIKGILESQKLTLGDVVMIHVYLGDNPTTDHKPDFSGMMAGYTQFFGTKEQPSKPARTTVQVVLPAAARGGLIEIDLVAVKTK
jgi:enamine deaminase RidA (YjgF/YER057c/UK114 family)